LVDLPLVEVDHCTEQHRDIYSRSFKSWNRRFARVILPRI